MIGDRTAKDSYVAVHREELSIQSRRTRRLEWALEAIRDLHDPDEGEHTYCHDCASLTPCPTRRLAVDGLRSAR